MLEAGIEARRVLNPTLECGMYIELCFHKSPWPQRHSINIYFLGKLRLSDNTRKSYH